MNQKYIESYRQRSYREEQRLDDRTMLYGFGVTVGLFIVAIGLSYFINSHKVIGHSPYDTSYSNRLERVIK